MNREEPSELKHLEDVLKKEKYSRLKQEELNSKLQDEYDLLLKKLAEAEVHIDQLRLGANVGINKRFILSPKTMQSSTLNQKLENRLHNPSTTTATTAPGSKVGQDRFTGEGYEWETVAQPRVTSDNELLLMEDVTDAVKGKDEDDINLALSQNTLPTNLSEIHTSIHTHGDQDDGVSLTQQELPKDPFYAGHNEDMNGYNTPFQLQLDQALSDENTEQLSLSDMTSSCIKMRASAESQHLARIFRIRSLQEQISFLTDKVNTHSFSLEDLSRGLDQILLDHERLTKDIEGSCVETSGKTPIKKKQALENEVCVSLSGYELTQIISPLFSVFIASSTGTAVKGTGLCFAFKNWFCHVT